MVKKGSGRVTEEEDPCTLTQYSRPVVDLAQCEAEVAERPDCEALLDILAFAYYSSELFHKARATYEKLIELDHGNPGYHYYLGNTLHRLGRHDAARSEWALAESLDQSGKVAPKARERLRQAAALAARPRPRPEE